MLIDESDCTVYHVAHIQTSKGSKKIVAAAVCKMGMPHSTAIAAKMIAKFKPRYLWMVGICAGIKGEVNLGDVIVADPCWDYGCGKYNEDQAGEIKFLQDPYQCTLDSHVKTRVSLATTNTDFIKGIPTGFSGKMPKNDLSLKIGPMVSGAAVVSSAKYLDAIIKGQSRKLIGMEMEAYGVMCAGELACEPKPKVIIAKSVCDFGDAEKEDGYQPYAAHTSANFFYKFTKEYLYS